MTLNNVLLAIVAYQDTYLDLYYLKGITKNFNNSKFMFLLTKNAISMILPNNGRVFGYPIFNNFMNFGYNILLKKEHNTVPLKLNHYLVFNNGNTIISLSFLKEYFFNSEKQINNSIIKETLNSSKNSKNELNINSNVSIIENNDLNLNKEMLASQLVEYSSLFDNNALNVYNAINWDNFFNNRKDLNPIEIYEFYEDYIFYNSLKKQNITIINFDYKFIYNYYDRNNKLNNIKIKNNLDKKDKFNCKLNDNFLEIINIKNYFFKEKENRNLFVNFFNNLEKNEINYKLIINFVKILYINNNSYLHLYFNFYNIENVDMVLNVSDINELLTMLDVIRIKRLNYCGNIVKEENDLFFNILKSPNFLDENSSKAQINDFLEELDNPSNHNPNSSLFKEYFLLRVIKNICNKLFDN